MKLGVLAVCLLPGVRKGLDREFRNLPKDMRGKRLLDVGFGNGAFLQVAEQLGCEAVGADPDGKVVEQAIALGLDVRRGGIEAWADQPGTFDAITLSHVIEHVHDPRSVLDLAFRLLKPGGLLWLETPNINSIGRERFGVFWRGLEAPRHLVLFSWQSISQLLEQVGFSKLTPVPNIYNYRGIAAKSIAVSHGLDSYDSSAVIPAKEKAYAWIVRARLMKNYRRSEFVTIAALKEE